VELKRFDDIGRYHQRVAPFLLAYEAAHNLLLGICSTLLSRSDYYGATPYLALVQDGDAVVAVAIRTPPHNLVLSLIPSEMLREPALALLAQDIFAVYGQLPGVLGPPAMSRIFAEEWQRLTGQSYRLSRRERIYQLDAVHPVAGVPGVMRAATEADHNLLVRWIIAFNQEAFGGSDPTDPERWVDHHALTSPTCGLFLWEDDEPVAMAGYGGPTPHGIRIGPVYTPPEHRRRGYASACVAALSQHLLDSGRQFCFLFTDVSNPTSNHIYQTIGYTPISDVDEYRFALSGSCMVQPDL
jgi:predicted GNAT family acetyltransferase